MLTSIWRCSSPTGTPGTSSSRSRRGRAGPRRRVPDWPQWFSDDHLWLVISVCAYLRETGDFDYLEQKVPYEDHAEETVWEHMLRAVDFTLESPRPARPAALRLLRLERHAQRRPRLGQGRERLDGDAVLPGDARPGGAVRISIGRPTPSVRRLHESMAKAINEAPGTAPGTRAPSTTTGCRSALPARRTMPSI
jgi:hypothetical protein